jgi:predicted Fe-S protein YdhL (DUF1289 family)
MDERTGWCVGCARSLDEIGAWSALSDPQKTAVWSQLAERHAVLALGLRRV